MFKNLFNFSGRIRRLEYGLSSIIFMILFTIGITLYFDYGQDGVLLFAFNTLLFWFIFAQGAKRCHDLGTSGFYQLVPFYQLWMIFQEGNTNSNRHGLPPKAILNTQPVSVRPIQLFPKGKTLWDNLNELLPSILFNTILMALCTYFFSDNYLILFFGVIGSILCSYLIMLLINFKGAALPSIKAYNFRNRMYYATGIYLCWKLYSMTFLNKPFDMSTGYLEFFLLLFIFGLTFVPFVLYKTIFNSRTKQAS